MLDFLSYYGIRGLELISAFLIVLLFLKIFGTNYKLKQMTALDLIINFTLGAILSSFIMNDNVSLSKFLVIMVIYILIVYTMNALIKNSNWGRRLLIGFPQVIIKDGKVNEHAMDRLNFSIHELASALRQENIHSLTQVKMAQIEPGGDLTIVKKGSKDYLIILIDNGVIDQEALSSIERSEKWLLDQLKKKQVKSPEDVFIAQWYRGHLHIVRKE